MHVKIFIYIKVFILSIFIFYLFLDFSHDKFLDKLLLFLLIFSLLNLINKRSEFVKTGYVDIRFDALFYTGPIILLTFFILVNLQFIDINKLKNKKDFSFSGYIVHGDIMHFGYDSGNGKGFLRERPLEYSRYVPSTGDFLFLENLYKNRVGFISCSIFTENCFDNYKKYLLKDEKQQVYITYQLVGDDNIWGGNLILTSIQSQTISLNKEQLLDKYSEELFEYKMIILLIFLIHVLFLVWNSNVCYRKKLINL